MYSSWLSAKEVPPAISIDPVLQSYPVNVGRSVVSSVVKSLTEAANVDEPSLLTTHDKVTWTMQVLGHGLTLPLQEYVLINQCLNIYSDWLQAAVSTHKVEKKNIPRPILETPEHYITMILLQYYSAMFDDKHVEGNLLHHQVNLCQTVLEITHSTLMGIHLKQETWNSIMTALLKVSDQLLSPPREPGSLGEQLSEKLIFVNMNIWLHMSSCSFPSPPLWKALRESCILWRHHPEVVQEWSALMISLTKKVILLLYGPGNCNMIADPKPAYGESVKHLSDGALVQCWYRMLHIVGNPVELSYPPLLSQSPAFQQAKASMPAKSDSLHPSLKHLNEVFYQAMSSVSSMADMFLMVNPVRQQEEELQREASSHQHSPAPGLRSHRQPIDLGKSLQLPPTQAPRVGKLQIQKVYSNPLSSPSHKKGPFNLSSSFGDIPLHMSYSSGHTPSSTQSNRPSRAKGSTLLHLYGSWLFEAVIWHNSSIPSNHPKAIQFEKGRSVALGCLCRIFCSLSPQDQIPTVYLARFYQALAIGLDYDSKMSQGYLLISVVRNSANLFRVGLSGINVLVPRFLKALSYILSKNHIKPKCEVKWKDLRSTAIQILLSLLPLPLHFQDLVIPDFKQILAKYSQRKNRTSSVEDDLKEEDEAANLTTFRSLCRQLQRLICGALDSEGDEENKQILLAGLVGMLQDSVAYENGLRRMDDTLIKEPECLSDNVQEQNEISPNPSGDKEEPKVTTVVPSKEEPKVATVVPSKEEPKVATVVPSKEEPKVATVVPSKEEPKVTTVVPSKEEPKVTTVVPSKEEPKVTTVVPSKEEPKVATVVPSKEEPKVATVVPSKEEPKVATVVPSKEGDEEITETASLLEDIESNISDVLIVVNEQASDGREDVLSDEDVDVTLNKSEEMLLQKEEDTEKPVIELQPEEPPSRQLSSANTDIAPSALYRVKQLSNEGSTTDRESANLIDILFKKVISVAEHILNNTKANFSVVLSALASLSGLAGLKLGGTPIGDKSKCKNVIELLCGYIRRGASKEGLSQTRDLHTTIVAAFWSILRWMLCRPQLVQEKDVLIKVMSVIELGISGSVSEKINNDRKVESIYKGDKEMKPLSGRVQQIAEYLLFCLMEKIGTPVSSGQLDEDTIKAKLCGQKAEAVFQYFIVDNAYIFGLLEDSPVPSVPSGLPQLTVIIRSPSGTHVWSMDMLHQPCSEPVSDDHLKSAPRPPFADNVEKEPLQPRRPWPDGVDQTPKAKADYSIPDITEVLDSDKLASITEEARSKLAEENVKAEKFKEYVSNLLYPDPSLAAELPKAQEKFQTARLFLSHIGLLDPVTLVKEERSGNGRKSILKLNFTRHFLPALKNLDSISTKFTNTVFMVYVKDGVTRPQDILANQANPVASSEFQEFQEGLGWIVDPATHHGFKGELHPLSDITPGLESTHFSVVAQKPFKPFVYYADLSVEVAFIMPILKRSHNMSSSSSMRSVESNDSTSDNVERNFTPSLPRAREGSGVKPSTVQAHAPPGAEKPGFMRSTPKEQDYLIHHRPKKQRRPQDCAVMVAWLENLDDMAKFPIRVLSQALHNMMYPLASSFTPGVSSSNAHKYYLGRPYLPVIFISSLPSGLYRIHTWIPALRHTHVGPLLDGSVVSKRVLPTLVRETAINICQAYRMEAEEYKPPSTLRRQKIEEISSDFSVDMQPWQLFSELFSSSKFRK